MIEKFDSSKYWESRYAEGGNSGKGSYGELAAFKAEVLNDFVKRNDIRLVIEFGCGDGNQLTLAKYPDYIGYDVSQTVLAQCRKSFVGDGDKKFLHVDEYGGEKADLVLSLDVLFHLVEDSVFDRYMKRLFEVSSDFVIIYCSNQDRRINPNSPHVRHRNFGQWVKMNVDNFGLVEKIENPFRKKKTREGFATPSDFYIYRRI